MAMVSALFVHFRRTWFMSIAGDAAAAYAAASEESVALALRPIRVKKGSRTPLVMVLDEDGFLFYGGRDFDAQVLSIDWEELRTIVLRKATVFGIYYGSTIEFLYQPDSRSSEVCRTGEFQIHLPRVRVASASDAEATRLAQRWAQHG
ncbi:hypothetical protein HQQ81_16965 [Microbacteriaceae bacterium VKM Ac-2854]|nr:hypothetical protein [Microbacteriaceae bacterium VKM Ac-2854]